MLLPAEKIYASRFKIWWQNVVIACISVLSARMFFKK